MAKNTFVVKGKDADLSIFPIGSIYMTMGNYNPSIYFGGTWEQVSKGKVLVGADESQPEFNTVRKTGGEKKHKLTVNEMPVHDHDVGAKGYGDLVHTSINYNSNSSHTHSDNAGKIAEAPNGGTDGAFHLYTYNRGGDQSHNNLQPYLTCFIWERIA